MLSQFQTRYPTGSLISELLTISQGKFIVRVSAQVEGVTRATGMAAAETLELAEDRARSRALAVLGIEPVPVLQRSKPEVEAALSPEQQIQINATFSSARSFAITPELDLEHAAFSQASPQDDNQERELQESPQSGKTMQRLMPSSTTPIVEDLEITPDQNESSGEAANSLDNVTLPLPLSYSPQDTSWLEPKGFELEKKTSVPMDLSDAIARTGIEIKRLKWNNQQGREYLKQKYGKRSRQELTDEEMLEFLHYLESQPSPEDKS